MNPFEDYTNSTNIETTETPIYIWVEQSGRKYNTYVSGWNIDNDTIKEHLKTIKRKNGCNGSIKDMEVNGNSIERVIQLQGDHVDYVKQFIITTGINESQIYIKG
jgi:translation initiation factor SUI1